MSLAQRFHALGQAIGLYNYRNPNGPLTATAVGNVFNAPHTLPMTLRHVWVKLLADDTIRALLEKSDYETLQSVSPANANYYLGYYLGLSGKSPEPEHDDAVPARVRSAREAAGLTQQQLADMLGVTKARISDVEQGRHFQVRLEWLVRLARVLQIAPSTLHPDLTDRIN